MKKVLITLGVLGGLIVVLFAAGIGNIGSKVARETILGQSPRDVAATASTELNGILPMMVDQETRLDSTLSGPGQLLSYNYTLINFAATQINALQLANLEHKVTQVTCEQQEQNLLSKNVGLQFRYRSSDGVLIREFTIRPKTCIYDPFAKAWGLIPL